ncbi:MAG: hypothetical protein WBG08_04715 [Litorimonas sp.]
MRELSMSETRDVAGGPIVIPVIVVKVVKLAGYATAAAGAGAGLTYGSAKAIDALEGDGD